MARLLAVDDDPTFTDRLVQALSFRGHAVWAAHSAQQALNVVRIHPLDVALLDLRLPDMSGHALARALRAQWDGVIIMLSAVGQEAEVVGSFVAGADDHLVKPFSLDELEARIAALLRRRAPGAALRPQPYEDAYLSFDPVRRLLDAAGQRVPLSPIEYALLARLIERRSRPVSKEELIGAAWPEPEPSPDREPYLAAYIASLRQKLERDPRNPEYILTCRGVGYRFQDRALPATSDGRAT